jgi:hypothetical protein
LVGEPLNIPIPDLLMKRKAMDEKNRFPFSLLSRE